MEPKNDGFQGRNLQAARVPFFSFYVKLWAGMTPCPALAGVIHAAGLLEETGGLAATPP